MFFDQPISNRFGNRLIAQIESEDWTELDIAVAWVRASGSRHLIPSLLDFLRRGNRIRFVIGLDMEHTSKEGLESLLDLSSEGDISVYVHHNEASTIFHPKLYLFRNATDASLIVASNNITESGLYRNTEAGLKVDFPNDHETIVSALNALDSWSDVTSGLAKLLDTPLLSSLEANGYVKTERALSQQRARSSASAASSNTRTKLFASVNTTPPPAPAGSASMSPAASSVSSTVAGGKSTPGTPVAKPSPSGRASPSHAAPGASAHSVPPSVAAQGQVLLMRVRKAHATQRPTQTQLPKAVAQSTFFGGATTVTSSHNNESHIISEATARGIVNTLKLEIPEMRDMADPVIRFEKTAIGIIYQAYDRASSQGQAIMRTLVQGQSDLSNPTRLTTPRTPNVSTWWRFI